MQRDKIIIFAILILGLLLRTYHLNRGDISYDEALTVVGAHPYISFSELCNHWFSKGHFPTYFIMMHYWMKLFGIGEAAARFPSVIFGVMSIYVMFLLGRKLFDKKTGILVACLFALSNINIYFSQFARPYSVAEFFVLMSFLFLRDSLEKDSNLIWFGYISFTIFSLLLSASILPIIICQIAFVAVIWPRQYKNISIKKLIFIFCAILSIYLPFLWRLIVPLLDNSGIKPLYWLKQPSIKTIMDIFDFFSGKCPSDIFTFSPPPRRYIAIENIYSIVLLCLCLVGIFFRHKPNKEIKNYVRKFQYENELFLSLWLLVPIFLPFVLSCVFHKGLLGPVKYVLYSSAAYYLLVNKGLLLLNRKSIRPILIIFLFCGQIMFLREYYLSINSMKKKGNIRLNLPTMYTYKGPTVTISGKLIQKYDKSTANTSFNIVVKNRDSDHIMNDNYIIGHGAAIARKRYYKFGPYAIKVPKNYGKVILSASLWNDTNRSIPDKKSSAIYLDIKEEDVIDIDFIF